MRKTICGTLVAGLVLLSTPTDVQGQVRRTTPTTVRRSPPTRPAPVASVRATGPIHVMTMVPVTVEARNLTLPDGEHLFRMEGETAECWPGVDATSVSVRATAAGGTVSYPVKLYFGRPEAHGRTCTLLIKAARPGEPWRRVASSAVQVERAETYVIENTWQLVPFVSSITATRVNAPNAPCTGLSAGLSGAVPIGPVEHDRDLSFHIRSGINQPDCVYASEQPYRQLKRGWVIIDREWRIEHARGGGDACSINNYSSDQPAGTYFYAHVQMRCGGGPDNDNGVRLILRRLTLLGPPNGSPLDAFISGSY